MNMMFELGDSGMDSLRNLYSDIYVFVYGNGLWDISSSYPSTL